MLFFSFGFCPSWFGFVHHVLIDFVLPLGLLALLFSLLLEMIHFLSFYLFIYFFDFVYRTGKKRNPLGAWDSGTGSLSGLGGKKIAEL